MDEGRIIEAAGCDGRTVKFAPFESGGERGKVEISFCLLALMTREAFVLKDGKYLAVEIDFAGFTVVDPGGECGDAGVQKMVDWILGRESL